MKAMVCTTYGSPDVLEFKEVETPTPKDNEVLVKVHAASINSWDWDLLRGEFMNRLIFRGFLKPKLKIIGCDIAGRVEAIGRHVTQFQPGDEVFGDISSAGWGAFAEYVCAPEDLLALKSAKMSFDDAAATPQAGVLALQGIRDTGQIQPGQKVLINGAGGGVGTFAIQIAKLFGAEEVTGVDHTSKLDIMRSVGADHVIDYTQEDFAARKRIDQNGQRYDLIMDVVASRSISDYKRALSPNGTFVMVGGTTSRIFQTMLLGPILSKTGSQKIAPLIHKPNKKDLNVMTELFEAGQVVPIIDRRYPLHQLPEALRYFGEGKVKGKIVITVEDHEKM